MCEQDHISRLSCLALSCVFVTKSGDLCLLFCVYIFYAMYSVNVLHGGVLAISLRAGDSSGSGSEGVASEST